MKTQGSFIISFLFVLIFLIFSFACVSKPVENVETVSPPVSTTSTPITSTQDSSQEIAGHYKVTGTNIDGKGAYSADLTITKRGEVYQFSWDSASQSYDGVGVRIGDTVSVSFTNGESGKGCGVVLYEIFADGSLDGKAGYWGVEQSETEKAIRTKGTDVVGEYDVTGRNAAGEEYKANLSISTSGLGLAFNWTGAATFQGFGIQQGNMLTAGFGDKQCSFITYQIKPEGSLEGKWGGLEIVTFGTEKAVKR